MIDSGRGTTRAKDAQGTPTQSHKSPCILVYDDKRVPGLEAFLTKCVKTVTAVSPDFFFFTLVTGPRRSLSLKLSDTKVYAP